MNSESDKAEGVVVSHYWRSPTNADFMRPIVGDAVAPELFSPASLNGFELDRTHFGFPPPATPNKSSISVGHKRDILRNSRPPDAEPDSPGILSKRLKALDPVGTPPKKHMGIGATGCQSFPKKSEPVSRNLMSRFLSTEIVAGSYSSGHTGTDGDVFLPAIPSQRDNNVFRFDVAPTPTSTTDGSNTEVAELTEMIETLDVHQQTEGECPQFRHTQQVVVPSQYSQPSPLVAPRPGFLFGYGSQYQYNPPVFASGPPVYYANVVAPVFGHYQVPLPVNQTEPAGRVWEGDLAVPNYERRGLKYSRKVFIGGIPVDLDTGEGDILRSFKKFGCCRLEWPGREARYRKTPEKQGKNIGKGYTYLIFDRPDSVTHLVGECTKLRFPDGGQKLTYEVTMMKKGAQLLRAIQVVPWIISDAVFETGYQEEKKFAAFVGAIHGRMSAKSLATVMDDTFGGVVGATLDMDKYHYPIGSGCVTFSNESSFKEAILTSFVNVSSAPLTFKKKLEINPYLEDKICDCCHKVHGKTFCRNFACFAYFCDECWQKRHNFCTEFAHHKPLVKTSSGNCSHSLGPSRRQVEGGPGFSGGGAGCGRASKRKSCN